MEDKKNQQLKEKLKGKSLEELLDLVILGLEVEKIEKQTDKEEKM